MPCNAKEDDMPADDITDRLLMFISQEFLDSGSRHDLDETTPLLEWGILSSMNMVRLLTYIRDELGYAVPADRINAENFGNIKCITAMISLPATRT
jgi:acyl carrier protein